ncbi:Alkane hydroxylase MAH1 [Bienertia sinuspersici]
MIESFKEFSDKLVYLHAALSETLRLNPLLPFNHKKSTKSDVLPSGHQVSTEIIFNMHAMGRMKSIWGDDCNEFKPERWLDERGMIKHELSYRFSAFSARPRLCLGKTMAFIQMKLVASIIIQNYHIEPIEEHRNVYDLSMILHMKNGFKVKVRRCSKC